MSSITKPSPRRVRPQVEQLETREVLSGYAPTAGEQLFLERLNDARANPAAYGSSIGLDLSNVAASQPLAWDTRLVQAARLHSQDMMSRDFFAHTNPSGLNPAARIAAAGFAARSWGESIAAGYAGSPEALAGLVIDEGVPSLGHRRHLLAIDGAFQPQNLVGVGIASGGGIYGTYFTVDTGQEYNSGPYLTGAVYHDANLNGRYDLNEGLGGVTVSVSGGPATTSFGSGGYSLALGPGTYTVTFSGGGLAAPIVRTVAVGGTNVRLNVTTTTPSQNPADAVWLDQVYSRVLERPPTASDYTYWLGMLQAGLTRQSVVSLMMTSPEYRSVDNVRWIRGAFEDLLGRAATSGDIGFWAWAMAQGVTREGAVVLISQSLEFNRGLDGSLEAWVDRVYERVLGRGAVESDLAFWRQISARGVSRGDMMLALSGSIEARAREASEWAARLYRYVLGREAGSSEIAFWSGIVQRGVAHDVIVGLFCVSQEFTARLSR